MEMKDKIKQRREELGLTLEEVGNIVGVGKAPSAMGDRRHR